MGKYFLIIILSYSLNVCLAQHGEFRKPLTPADFLFLKKEAAECFGFNAHLQLSYNNQDFSSDKNKQGDLPASNENAELLKKKIEKEPQNVLLYTELNHLNLLPVLYSIIPIVQMR